MWLSEGVSVKSRLLRNDYDTGWKHKVERPISSRTKLKMMGACLLGSEPERPAPIVSLDQSLITYAVVFFSLGYLLNL